MSQPGNGEFKKNDLQHKGKYSTRTFHMHTPIEKDLAEADGTIAKTPKNSPCRPDQKSSFSAESNAKSHEVKRQLRFG